MGKGEGNDIATCLVQLETPVVVVVGNGQMDLESCSGPPDGPGQSWSN